MKYTNIKKLLIKFIGGCIIKFPTKFLRNVDIEGDNDDSIELNDLKSFNISVNDNDYYLNCEVGQDIQIDEIFDIVPFDVFKTLMSLKPDYNIVFNVTSSEGYANSSHTITLKPNGVKSAINHNIQIITQTIYSYPIDYHGPVNSNANYDIGFMFDGENLLQVKYKTDLNQL